MSKQAIMVLGHGSRDEQACSEFTALVGQIQARMDGWLVGHGWLEFARPTIGEGLELLRQAGATDILAVPGMLFAAGHVKNDLPSELHEFAERHPEVRIRMGRDLSIDPKLLRAAADRIEAAWDQAAEASPEIERKDSLLLVVGRGTSDPDANGNVAKVARMLGEGLGFGFVDCAFSGVAHPRTGEALERWMRLEPKRVLVFPYFLFSGILVNRIRSETETIAARFPSSEIVSVDYLGLHRLVVESFIERIREIETGNTAMNCQLCKYRTRIVGYEAEVGAVQQGHHHHVRGANHDHHHDHRDAHGHEHGTTMIMTTAMFTGQTATTSIRAVFHLYTAALRFKEPQNKD